MENGQTISKLQLISNYCPTYQKCKEREISMNNTTIRFTYMGDPVPKPRMTQRDKWQKRPPVVRYWAFADEFILKARLAGFKTDMSPRKLNVVAYIGMPKSWSLKKKRELAGTPHIKKPGPDADNIMKAVADSLVSEDVSIFRKCIEKYWDDGNGPRLEVEITAVHNDKVYV